MQGLRRYAIIGTEKDCRTIKDYEELDETLFEGKEKEPVTEQPAEEKAEENCAEEAVQEACSPEAEPAEEPAAEV